MAAQVPRKTRKVPRWYPAGLALMAAGIDQTALAAASGYSLGYVSNCLCGLFRMPERLVDAIAEKGGTALAVQVAIAAAESYRVRHSEGEASA